MLHSDSSKVHKNHCPVLIPLLLCCPINHHKVTKDTKKTKIKFFDCRTYESLFLSVLCAFVVN